MIPMQYTALYGCYSLFLCRRGRGDREEGKVQKIRWTRETNTVQILVSHCHLIGMYHSFSRVCVSIGGCWQSVVCYHLFSWSPCLPVPSWFCLSVFYYTLPWCRSWVCSLLHFSLVRKWDVAEREREREKEKTFTPLALCHRHEIREGQWHWMSARFSLIPVETEDRQAGRERRAVSRFN